MIRRIIQETRAMKAKLVLAIAVVSFMAAGCAGKEEGSQTTPKGALIKCLEALVEMDKAVNYVVADGRRYWKGTWEDRLSRHQRRITR